MDFILRFEQTESGDVAVMVVPGAGVSEQQAEYMASALTDLVEWDELYQDVLEQTGGSER